MLQYVAFLIKMCHYIECEELLRRCAYGETKYRKNAKNT